MALIETVATKEPKSLCATGDREIEREWAVAIRVERYSRRVDRNFVGEGPKRGQHPRAADAVQGRAFLEIVEPADVAAALQIYQGMCENQIILAQVFVVTAHIVTELR